MRRRPASRERRCTLRLSGPRRRGFPNPPHMWVPPRSASEPHLPLRPPPRNLNARRRRSVRASGHDLVLAVVRAAVAADGVAIVALLAGILLHDTVAAPRAEPAHVRAAVVCARVHRHAEVALFAEEGVELAVAAEAARNAAWRATRHAARAVESDVDPVVAFFVIRIDLAVAAEGTPFAVGRAAVVTAGVHVLAEIALLGSRDDAVAA